MRWFLIIVVLLVIRISYAIPPRNVSLDVGLGTPQVLFVGANVVVSSHFQIGVTYTPIPNSILFHDGFDLPSYTTDITYSGDIKETFILTPHIKPSLLFLSPVLRFFPTERNFYIQFLCPLIILNAKVSGVLKPQNENPTLLASISGNINLTQPLPTISIGHVFNGKLFFIDLNIGASFFTKISTNIEVSGVFSDIFTNSDAINEALQELKRNFENETNKAADELKKHIFLIPSINVRFGIML